MWGVWTKSMSQKKYNTQAVNMYFLEELLALSPVGQGAAADLSADLCEYKKNCSNPRWSIRLMLHCPF